MCVCAAEIIIDLSDDANGDVREELIAVVRTLTENKFTEEMIDAAKEMEEMEERETQAAIDRERAAAEAEAERYASMIMPM